MTRPTPLPWLVAALVAALLAAAPPALAASGADEAPTLTLAEAVAAALGRYPALAAARARVEQADQSLGEVRTELRPSLSAALFGARYGEPLPVTPIHAFEPALLPELDDLLFQGALQVDFTLFDSGRAERERQAGAELVSERAALDAGEQEVGARVAGLYARVLTRRDKLAAQRLRTEAVRAELGRVEQLLAVGKAPEVDRLRAEAAVAGAEADEVRAATELDSAERDLARLAGLEVEAARAGRLAALAEPVAPDRAREQLEAAAISARPEIAAARAALEAAAAGEALARTGYHPKLHASGLYQELGASELAFTSEWNVALRLSVPIWDGGATGRRVSRAAAGLDEARARLAQAELDARQGVDRALAAWADAEARAVALARAEQRLAEVARIQKLLLEVGSGTQIDYLDAESELAETRAARAETLGSALVARVELAHATGELSLDWLVRNLETSR